ncbi:hypothetical protein RGQ29_015198 [Quercus rubra]|uniref:Pentatricopeptide repeat-containing protein n=1 Tax=Quercus rubra TaxID=3512 RepID=A0AAN7J496_QUERU|nr:hypothetical protein RGQ29_015198 [Quercus rubra]
MNDTDKKSGKGEENCEGVTFERMVEKCFTCRLRPFPSIVDFNQLLGAIARMKHYSEVINQIRDMESLGIAPNIFGWNSSR